MAKLVRLSLEAFVLLLGSLVYCDQVHKQGIGYDDLEAALTEYDTLHTSHLTHSHTSHPHSRRVKFSSLGREFELHLKPNKRFTSDFAAHSVDADGNLHRFHINTEEFYQGFVIGEEGSRVTAHLSSDGVLFAHITTHNETFHIEPSAHYITKPHPFHMISYRGSHVKDRLSTARVDYSVPPMVPESDQAVEQSQFHSSSRLKRQAFPGRIRDSSCSVLLVGDHTMFNLLQTKESVATRMIQLVLSVDAEIYRETQWILSPDGTTVNGLGMFIQGTLVHDEPPRVDNPRNYSSPDSTLDARDLLLRMKFGDWQNFCLVHLFVNRDFSSGLLGLANIASSSLSQTGGICSRRFRDSSLPGTPFVIYNTGLTTVRNNGQLMVASELLRVTGHEIGHNWGSHHDPPSCGSGWLMNEFAQDGSQPTHSEFSSCSRTGIGQVLLSKATCFMSPLSLCGDYRIEEGEACDVGGATNDPCCTSECTLRSGADCSDQNFACCQNCQAAPPTLVCRAERSITLDCVTDTFCNGVNWTCPEQSPRAADGAPCINGVCRDNGAETICEDLCVSMDMLPCICTGVNECLLCCRASADELCQPTEDLMNMTLPLSNGAPCGRGVCFEGVCSNITQDEIARIWNIIVSLDVDQLGVLVSQNIVGCVLLFTLLLWCPVSCIIHYGFDSPLWKRFKRKKGDQTDLGLWYSERISAYRAFVDRVPSPEEGTEEQPLLATVPEEDEEPPSSPVDDQPAPTYS